MSELFHDSFDSPIGMISVVADDEFVREVRLDREFASVRKNWLTEKTKAQIIEYFAGKRYDFDLPVLIEGTPFQKRVYEALRRIPYGTVASYRDLTYMAGSRRGFQATGQVLKKNRLLLLVPCHRIINSDGSLGGYGSRPDAKRYLLQLEGGYNNREKGDLMKEKVFVSDSAIRTREIGCMLAEQLVAGSLITLSGDLGAGKTTFTQGIARGLGITGKVTSPTFNIMKRYKGRLPLYHIDAYRLENIVQDLGFEEYVEGDGVCVIEWADFMDYMLPDECLRIEFVINDDETRTITLTARGRRYEEVLEKLCIQ